MQPVLASLGSPSRSAFPGALTLFLGTVNHRGTHAAMLYSHPSGLTTASLKLDVSIPPPPEPPDDAFPLPRIASDVTSLLPHLVPTTSPRASAHRREKTMPENASSHSGDPVTGRPQEPPIPPIPPDPPMDTTSPTSSPPISPPTTLSSPPQPVTSPSRPDPYLLFPSTSNDSISSFRLPLSLKPILSPTLHIENSMNGIAPITKLPQIEEVIGLSWSKVIELPGSEAYDNRLASSCFLCVALFEICRSVQGLPLQKMMHVYVDIAWLARALESGLVSANQKSISSVPTAEPLSIKSALLAAHSLELQHIIVFSVSHSLVAFFRSNDVSNESESLFQDFVYLKLFHFYLVMFML